MQQSIKKSTKKEKEREYLLFVQGKYGLNKLENRKIMVKIIGRKIVKIKERVTVIVSWKQVER